MTDAAEKLEAEAEKPTAKILSVVENLPPTICHQNTIDTLKAALARAEKGEVVGVGLVLLLHDGNTITEWMSVKVEPLLLGAGRLMRRLEAAYDEQYVSLYELEEEGEGEE